MKLDIDTMAALRSEARALVHHTTAVLTGLDADSYRERIEKAARRIAELAGIAPVVVRDGRPVAESFDEQTLDMEPES